MKTYTPWMRYVNFNRLINIFQLISKQDSGLSFAEIKQVKDVYEILNRKNGKLLSESTVHSYLNTMCKLNLIEKKHGRYIVSKKEEAAKLSTVCSDKEQAKEILASIVVSNKDCRHYFFDFMMPTKNYKLSDLRENGSPIKLTTKEYASLKQKIMVITANNGRELLLENKQEKTAVFNGIRKWAIELGIVDELFPGYSIGYVIAPIKNSVSDANIKREVIENIYSKLLCSLSGWFRISIPAIVLDVFTTKRYSVESIKKAILNIKNDFSSCMILEPTSSAMVDLGTPYFKQIEILHKAYLKDSNGALLSHVNIHVEDFKKLYIEKS